MLNRRNLVLLEGNLTRDPDVHTLANGAQVVHFTIAVNGAGSSANEKNKAGFFDCKFWLTDNDFAAAADVAAARQGFTGEWKKGERISVFARLAHESWEKDGKSLSKVVLICDKVESLTYRPNGTTGEQGVTGQPQTQAQPVQPSSVPNTF